MDIDRLTISGPILAGLLTSALSNGRACDGLLLGSVSTALTTEAHDSAESLVIEKTEGRIAGSCTCAGTHSFYTNSGKIQDSPLLSVLEAGGPGSTAAQQQQLLQQLGRQQLLGWFSYRPGSKSIPSMRELAVCRSLHAWVNSNGWHQQQHGAAAVAAAGQAAVPVVFGLITSQQDHNGATTSLRYRFFQFRPNSNSSNGSSNSWRTLTAQHQPQLAPSDLLVLNLGQWRLAMPGNYGASSNSSTNWQLLPALAGSLYGGDGSSSEGSDSGNQNSSSQAPAGFAGVLSPELHQQLLQASHDAVTTQVAALQGLYRSLLDELQTVVAQLSSKQTKLDELRAQNEQLRQQLLNNKNLQASMSVSSGPAAVEAAGTKLQDVSLL